MIKKKKVALLGTHGIPARHGAFEQTIFKLCEIARLKQLDVHFYVGCSKDARVLEYDEVNVTRVFANRPSGIGILWYDLATSIKSWVSGARTFVYFGYEFAPFFIFFRLLGVTIICNVDGIEWRRAKWGSWPKRYFKLCESLAARTSNQLIFDAHGIARYYAINHKVEGSLVFYGSDPLPEASKYEGPAADTYYSVVMRMEPENNIKVIVEGFAKAKTDKKLILIGPSTPFFENQCMPFVDGNKIFYMGPIYDREQLAHIRRNSFAYIHGHSVGGTNPTLVEAIGLRNSIVAYNSIFNREVCGVSAQYFNGPEDLANIIEQEEVIPPPIIGPEYEWDYVANRYYNICKIGSC